MALVTSVKTLRTLPSIIEPQQLCLILTFSPGTSKGSRSIAAISAFTWLPRERMTAEGK